MTIYQDLKDRFVVATVIYTKSSDGKAYVDEAGKTQFKTSELKEAFIKGCIIKTSTGYVYPVEYSETSKVGSVKYISGTSSLAFTALAAVADA